MTRPQEAFPPGATARLFYFATHLAPITALVGP